MAGAEFMELGLEALTVGIEKFPERHFDRIPGFRPPKEKREQIKAEKKAARKRSNSTRDKKVAAGAGAGAAAGAADGAQDNNNDRKSRGRSTGDNDENHDYDDAFYADTDTHAARTREIQRVRNNDDVTRAQLAQAWEEGYLKGRGSSDQPQDSFESVNNQEQKDIGNIQNDSQNQSQSQSQARSQSQDQYQYQSQYQAQAQYQNFYRPPNPGQFPGRAGTWNVAPGPVQNYGGDRSRSIANQDNSKQLTTRPRRHSWSSQPPTPIQPPEWANMDGSYFGAPPSQDSYRRYNPADYQPQAPGSGSGAGGQGGYNDYNGYQGGGRRSDYDDDRREGSRRHSRRQSGRRYSDEDDDDNGSRSRSRSRSKERDIQKQLQQNFDGSQRGLATGALGALAGGWLAHEVASKHGGKKGKKGTPWPAVAGAVLGGLGANAWEAHEHRRRDSRREERDERSDSRRARSSDANAYGGRELEYRRDSSRGASSQPGSAGGAAGAVVGADDYYYGGGSRAVTGPYDRGYDNGRSGSYSRDAAYANDRSAGSYGGGSRSRSRGGGEPDEYYEDVQESDDSYTYRKMQKKEKKREKRAKEEREANEGHFNWGNILHS